VSTPDPRKIAEQVIRHAARNPGNGDLNAAILDLGLTPGEVPALRRSVREEIARALVAVTWPDDEPRHIVDLRASGWTVQHPDGCRPNLFDCPVNVAAERDLVNQPVRLGRFVCALDDDGRFKVGAEIEP
jgi:hypothetical protein